MKKSPASRNELETLESLGTLMKVEDEAARQISSEDFAKYSHAMLLSLQKLALKQGHDAFAQLLGSAASGAKRLMKVKVAA